MDISRWTIDERMQLPDWCFGNRKIYSCYVGNYGVGSIKWDIFDFKLPDPACIWTFGIILREHDYKWSYFRVGLCDVKPTTVSQMDKAVSIFPGFGFANYTPPKFYMPLLSSTTNLGWNFNLQLRNGLVTGGKKFVIESYLSASGTVLTVTVFIVASGLPTNISGWLAESFKEKVR